MYDATLAMALDVFITILLGSVTVVLTALAVMLAVLGVGIAILAFYGYTGLKDELKKMAITNVSDAMTAKLQEYPSGESILGLIERLKSSAEFYEQMQAQMVTPPEPNVIERTSNSVVQVGTTTQQAPSAPTGVTASIEPYPEEETGDVHENRSDSTPSGNDSGNSGTGSR
jgi:hypothetical protein